MKLRSRATVSLSAVSDVVILVPPGKGADSHDELERSLGTTENTLLHGTVTLNLPKSRIVKEILVELVARQSVIVDGFRHTYGIREASVSVPLRSTVFEAGTYHFPFELVVPSNAAPSDSIPYGRCVQNLIASVKGAGPVGRTITTTKPITIVSQHTSGLPPGFTLDTTAFSANLGAIIADVSSTYMTVAGSIDLKLEVRDILKPLRIDDVRVDLIQKYETKALDERWSATTKAQDIVPVWSVLGNHEPTMCEPGSSFSICKRIRLPNEMNLRPSTPKACLTGIKVAHKLSVIITYTPLGADVQKKQKKEFCIAMPVTISSCRSMVAGNQLPAYVEKEGPTQAPRYSSPPCLCSMNDPERDLFVAAFVTEPLIGDTGTPAVDIAWARKRSDSSGSELSCGSNTVEIE